jgi:Flp pilus assembly protein TadD
MKFQTTVLIAIVIASCFTLTAWTQQSSVQQQAWTYILQARQGDATAAENAVSLLEPAAAAAPNDAALWNLLGRSYFFRLSTQSRNATSLDQAIPALKSATEAFDHVLKINPDDPTALSGHGMALTLLGAFQQKQ